MKTEVKLRGCGRKSGRAAVGESKGPETEQAHHTSTEGR